MNDSEGSSNADSSTNVNVNIILLAKFLIFCIYLGRRGGFLDFVADLFDQKEKKMKNEK